MFESQTGPPHDQNMSGEMNMITTVQHLGGASPSKFGAGQSRDIVRGGPFKEITLYIQACCGGIFFLLQKIMGEAPRNENRPLEIK